MLKRSRQNYGTPTLLLFAAVTLFNIAVIIHSLWRPLWYDEAWRPDFVHRNMDIPLADRESYAPISLGMFMLTKATFLLGDSNFTVRLITYVALLALPFMVYAFCRMFLDKRTAYVMVPVSVLLGYVLEFSTQAKPYLMDIVATLGILIIYRCYLAGKLRLRHFILASSFYLILSFGAFFVLPCLGIHLLWRARKGDRAKYRSFAVWAATLAPLGLGYFYFFLKPQLTGRLFSYYKALYPHGSIFNILHNTFSNLLTYFGIDLGKPLSSPGLETSPALWTVNQFHVHNRPVLGFSTFMGLLYLGAFVYGVLRLYRSKKYFLIGLLGGVLGLEWIAALLRQWAFGNARTNLFSTILVTIIICYGLVQAGIKGLRKYRLATATCFITLLILVFPYQTVRAAVSGLSTFANNQGVNYGLASATAAVAQQSKTTDYVLVGFYAGAYDFHYFYIYADYITQYRPTAAQHIVYAYRVKQPVVWAPIDQHHPQRVWLLDEVGVIDDEKVAIPKHGYKVSKSQTFGDIAVLTLDRL